MISTSNASQAAFAMGQMYQHALATADSSAKAAYANSIHLVLFALTGQNHYEEIMECVIGNVDTTEFMSTTIMPKIES